MTDREDLTPALRVAVAVTTAVNELPSRRLHTSSLVGDVDPLAVVEALGVALHAALGVTLGADGRREALAAIGLSAALERP